MENLEQERGNIDTEKIKRNNIGAEEIERSNIDTEEIKMFCDMIKTKMRNVIRPSGKLNMEAHERFMDFMDELEEKYGKKELRKCAAFHAATGSSIMEDGFVDITRLDFTGEDSIENFFDSQK